MVLWDTSPPSSQPAEFSVRVTIPFPKTSSLDLLACHEVSSISLGSVTYVLCDTLARHNVGLTESKFRRHMRYECIYVKDKHRALFSTGVVHMHISAQKEAEINAANPWDYAQPTHGTRPGHVRAAGGVQNPCCLTWYSRTKMKMLSAPTASTRKGTT